MKGLLLFTLFMLFCSYGASAQDHEPQFVHDKYQHPTQLIADNMLPDVFELSKLCINSVTFVRFRVGADGNVKDVACTPNTPAVIAKTLKNTIKSTSGHWVPKEQNGKAVESKPYLLPVVYDVNFGCTGDEPSSNMFEDAIRLVLNFDDGSTIESMECTLLPPMVQRYKKK